MKAKLLEALERFETIQEYSYLNDADIDILRSFKDYRGISIKFCPDEDNNHRAVFSFDALNDINIDELCDFSKQPLNFDEFCVKPINNELCKIIIAPYYRKNVHLADLILIISAKSEYDFAEWCLFAEYMANFVCRMYRYPALTQTNKGQNPEHLLSFLKETQNILDVKATTLFWSDKDAQLLISFLKKLIDEFSLYAAHIIQRTSPGYCSYIELISADQNEICDLGVGFLINEIIAQQYPEGTQINKTYNLKVGKLDFPPCDPVPMFIPCCAGGRIYGHLGIMLSQREAQNMNSILKLMPMLTNQLGLHFSHIYRLRREAVRSRLLRQMNKICSEINSTVNVSEILQKTAEALNILFGQKSGAILLNSRETFKLEVEQYLSNDVPKEFEGKSASEYGEQVLNTIKNGIAIDNRTGRLLNLPIRCILPLATTNSGTNKSTNTSTLGGLILFNSENNEKLSDEDFEELLPNFLTSISSALHIAFKDDIQVKTIQNLEGLIQYANNPEELLDEAISTIKRLLKVSRISFLEADEKSKKLLIKQGLELPQNIIGTEVNFGEGISGYVAEHMETCRIDDIEKDERFMNRSKEAYFNKSILSVPLISKRLSRKPKVLGVINVNNKIDDSTFNPQDQQLLEAVSHLLVTALENARLMQDEHEKQLLDRQLYDAKEIQMSLMPKQANFQEMPPAIGVFGKSNPAKQIGGDFFDLIPLDDGRLLVVLGDVSGKGMPAAILMAMTRMIIHSVVQNCSDPVTILERVNNKLCKELDSYHFVTLQLVAINPKTGECEMSSAGHGPLMVRLKSHCQLIESRSGAPVGIDGLETHYVKEPFGMIANDTLIMFTDGLSEERSPDGEMFGTERVMDIMEKKSDDTAKNLCEALINAAVNWRKNAEAHDDLTVLALKFKGRENA